MRKAGPGDPVDCLAAVDGRIRALRGASWWPFALVTLVAGIVIGLAVPPPYADGAWWATYVTSPGFAGTVAFIGASIAAWVAWHNSRKDRAQRQLADQRSQWWNRFTWATEKAGDPASALVGIKVLNKLVLPGLATEDDARIALEISEIVLEAQEPGEGGETT
jgi:hypothetical protein